MDSSDSWTTIESDPGVFTELIEKMGVKGVEVAELWSCDPSSLNAVQPLYGLIFLFKWQKEDDTRGVDEDASDRGVFFAKQVINNACATQAIISVLMNIPSGTHGFELGDELSNFKSFTSEFSPEMKGLAIGNSDTIRTCHNSFRAPQPLLPEEPQDDNEGEAFHFVAYAPVANGLYELDGLKPGPIRICDCDATEWTHHAAEAVNARIQKYADAEVRFNLMAIVRSRLDMYSEQICEAEKQLEQLGETDEGKISALQSHIKDLKSLIQAEEAKRQRWHRENIRRRTDFTPFIFNLLKGLSKIGKLDDLISEAEGESRSKASRLDTRATD